MLLIYSEITTCPLLVLYILPPEISHYIAYCMKLTSQISGQDEIGSHLCALVRLQRALPERYGGQAS